MLISLQRSSAERLQTRPENSKYEGTRHWVTKRTVTQYHFRGDKKRASASNLSKTNWTLSEKKDRVSRARNLSKQPTSVTERLKWSSLPRRFPTATLTYKPFPPKVIGGQGPEKLICHWNSVIYHQTFPASKWRASLKKVCRSQWSVTMKSSQLKFPSPISSSPKSSNRRLWWPCRNLLSLPLARNPPFTNKSKMRLSQIWKL